MDCVSASERARLERLRGLHAAAGDGAASGAYLLRLLQATPAARDEDGDGAFAGLLRENAHRQLGHWRRHCQTAPEPGEGRAP